MCPVLKLKGNEKNWKHSIYLYFSYFIQSNDEMDKISIEYIFTLLNEPSFWILDSKEICEMKRNCLPQRAGSFYDTKR